MDQDNSPNVGAGGTEASGESGGRQARYRIDTAQMKSSYCNASNVLTTREEVVINFGLNESWDLGKKDFAVDLHHRVILSPVAAKRLQQTLGKLLQEYEARYGALN